MAEQLQTIRTAVAELETQCAQLAAHIDAREWTQLENLLHEMGKARHALINAWEESAATRDPAFDREMSLRVRRVFEYRAWQIKRLHEYGTDVSGRLAVISQWKSYARSVAGKGGNRAALFSDLR